MEKSACKVCARIMYQCIQNSRSWSSMVLVVVGVSYRVLHMMIILHVCVRSTMLVMFGFCVYYNDICELCIFVYFACPLGMNYVLLMSY